MAKILDSINSLADEFGEIAKKVNESSKQRKAHSEKASDAIEMSLKLGKDINVNMRNISSIDLDLRNQNNVVLHTCIVINTNLEYQNKMVKELEENDSINSKITGPLISKINDLSNSVNDATAILYQIQEVNDRIILLDNLITRRKKIQKDRLIQLKTLTKKTLAEAERAIKGSSSNLARGLEMAKKLKAVAKLVDGKNRKELNALILEANRGSNIAEKVNKSSISQMDFAEKVNHFTGQVYQDSIAIKELIASKHDFFNRNLKMIKALPKILTKRLGEFLKIESLVNSIEYDENLEKNLSILINNLIAHVDIACDDIRKVANINYDITDKNNRSKTLEDKIIELTNKELDYNKKIKDEIAFMTKATKYPIEGSGKNISNGRTMEKYLKEILKSI